MGIASRPRPKFELNIRKRIQKRNGAVTWSSLCRIHRELIRFPELLHFGLLCVQPAGQACVQGSSSASVRREIPGMMSRTPLDDGTTDSGAASTVPRSVDGASEVADGSRSARGTSQGKREVNQASTDERKTGQGSVIPVKPNQSEPRLCFRDLELIPSSCLALQLQVAVSRVNGVVGKKNLLIYLSLRYVPSEKVRSGEPRYVDQQLTDRGLQD